MPGTSQTTEPTKIVASFMSLSNSGATHSASIGINPIITLCETVTTGKCLIGLTCGSMSSVTQKTMK